MVFTTLLVFSLFSSARALDAKRLHEAAQRGDVDLMKELLENNPKLVNSRNDNGCTSLQYAAYSGQLEAVRLLIEKKADVDVKGSHHGWTPLYLAAMKGHRAIAEHINHQWCVSQSGVGKTRTNALSCAQIAILTSASIACVIIITAHFYGARARDAVYYQFHDRGCLLEFPVPEKLLGAKDSGTADNSRIRSWIQCGEMQSTCR